MPKLVNALCGCLPSSPSTGLEGSPVRSDYYWRYDHMVTDQSVLIGLEIYTDAWLGFKVQTFVFIFHSDCN